MANGYNQNIPEIATYIFFDIETTGLPWQERNRTKIIEMSFVSVLRENIEKTPFSFIPPVHKLTLMVNPQYPINPKVTEMTGLNNIILKHAPVFKKQVLHVSKFFQKQQKPICLVAHNGNIFDFKILLAECRDAQFSLSPDLKCLDSLVGFRKLLKGSSIDYHHLKASLDDLLTDDEDDWPGLDVSLEEWEEIDEICVSTSSESNVTGNRKKCNVNKNHSTSKNVRSKSRDEIIKDVFSKKDNAITESFTLSALYKRLLNKEPTNAHRAEADCMMLLECVVALKKDFLPWSDESCKFLTEIKPLIRY